MHPEGPALSAGRKAKVATEHTLAHAATPVFSFKSATYSVLEKQGKVTLTVLRGGPLDITVRVKCSLAPLPSRSLRTIE